MQVGRRGSALVAAVVCVIGFWAWTSGLAGPYHFDDFVTPLNDPASQSLPAWEQHLSLTLRPVTKLTYALEADAGWSREPAPRRLVSLVLHAATAGLLFVLILRLVPSCSPMLATLLASLWFLHPVHADNLLLLSGRSAGLSGLLLLAALVAFERSRSWWAGVLFVLACLARETALAGLFPLAVLAASRPGASMRSTVRELGPPVAGALLVCLWIATTPRYLHLAEYSFLGRPFWQSVASQVGAIPVGLGLLFEPSALSIDYGLPLPTQLDDARFVLGLGMLLGAGLGALVLLKRSRAAAVGLALWLAALLPTQSVIPKLDPLTNRPLSLALAGLLLVAAPLLSAAARRWRFPTAAAMTRPQRDVVPAGLRLAVAGGVIALVGSLSAATASRAALFESELSLWADAAAKSTVNARPHLRYARALLHLGRQDAAGQVLADAGRIDPFSSQIAALRRAYPSIEVSR